MSTQYAPSTPFPPFPIIDTNIIYCGKFLDPLLKAHQATQATSSAPPRPFVIGLNGIQGAGKTTLVSFLSHNWSLPPRNLSVLVFSIDDLYLPHDEQVALAAAHPDNPLIQHRGEPGTHDVALGKNVLDALLAQQPVQVPSYDKAAHAGAGDRVPREQWRRVNDDPDAKIQVVIFEGWCVGFRALSDEAVEQRWRAAQAVPTSRLRNHRLEDLLLVNAKLREYDVLTDCFDAFIHLHAFNTEYVYEWRLQQERGLRAQRGTGMTDEQVVSFVDGYYPAYELYTDGLKRGIFQDKGPEWKGRQLRLTLMQNRNMLLQNTI